MNEQYRMARDLIDRAVCTVKSLREKHSLRFISVATQRLDTLAWVAAHILKICTDPIDFRMAVDKAVAEISEEHDSLDRLRVVHDVMRRLGVAFS